MTGAANQGKNRKCVSQQLCGASSGEILQMLQGTAIAGLVFQATKENNSAMQNFYFAVALSTLIFVMLLQNSNVTKNGWKVIILPCRRQAHQFIANEPKRFSYPPERKGNSRTEGNVKYVYV